MKLAYYEDMDYYTVRIAQLMRESNYKNGPGGHVVDNRVSFWVDTVVDMGEKVACLLLVDVDAQSHRYMMATYGPHGFASCWVDELKPGRKPKGAEATEARIAFATTFEGLFAEAEKCHAGTPRREPLPLRAAYKLGDAALN